ncbi:HIT domain-containing protein [Lysobacter humi (ex Lee et al. 2017)]
MTAWSLHPRLRDDTHHVVSLALADVLLMDDANYPWLILVPRVAGAVEWVGLDPADAHRLLDEITLASAVLRELVTPDKLNVAALGNVVAQLHVHVVARFEGDAAWPRPVWGAVPARAYDARGLGERLDRLRAAFARHAVAGVSSG